MTAKTPKLYQVVGWRENFEGAKSKDYKNKSTCQMPTKHGLGYKRLVRSKDGAALFGAWCAMIQVLSRHANPRQGYCTDTGQIQGRPYAPEDLEMLTDIPAKHFSDMLQRVAQEDIAWVKIPDGYHADTTRPLQYPLDSDLDSDLDLDLDSKPCGSFDGFWNCYPIKKGKAAAEKSFARAVKSASPDEIIAAVEKQKRWPEWTKENGAYIPHPATWLNQGRWTDEPKNGTGRKPLSATERMNMTKEQIEAHETGGAF
jgi:hypothetical protein